MKHRGEASPIGNATRNFTVTNSERGCFYECPFKWLLKYGLQLATKVPPLPLRLGRQWHSLLDLYWVDGPGAAFKLLRSWESTVRKMGERYDPADSLHNRREELLEQLEILDGMLVGYHTTYNRDWQVFTAVEVVVEARPRPAPGKRRMLWGIYAGKLDKTIEDHGRWLVDHKSSSYPLIDWRDKHDYSPQGATYAVLMRAAGKPVEGIIYDLALKLAPAEVGDYPVNKDGTLSKKLPKGAVSSTFVEAANQSLEALRRAAQEAEAEHATALAAWQAASVALEDADGGDAVTLKKHLQDAKAAAGKADNARMKAAKLAVEPQWYREKAAELRGQDGRFFRREYIKFTDEELDRAEYEMATVLSTIRQAEKVLLASPAVAAARATDTPGEPHLDAIADVGRHFPRNGNACTRMGRCRMMDLCRHQSLESLREFRCKTDRHEELHEEVPSESNRATESETVSGLGDLW